MRLKEKKLLQKFAATLKKFSAQGAKKVEYSNPLKWDFIALNIISVRKRIVDRDIASGVTCSLLSIITHVVIQFL